MKSEHDPILYINKVLRKSGYHFIERYNFTLRISLKDFRQAVISKVQMIDWQLFGQKKKLCDR